MNMQNTLKNVNMFLCEHQLFLREERDGEPHHLMQAITVT